MVLVNCILDFEAEQVLLTHFFHNLKIEGAGNGFQAIISAYKVKTEGHNSFLDIEIHKSSSNESCLKSR